MTKARRVCIDIETAPSIGYVWGMYEQDVIDLMQDWFILSFAWKWEGDKRVQVAALPDYPGYAKNRKDDRALVEHLWRIFDEADILVAHNGARFDFTKSNTRFIKHGLPPPSPYKFVDTLQVARRAFRFDSNRLDALGRYLHIGRKLPHTGFHLWKGCMDGDAAAWKLMKKYNAHDVELLEEVYMRLMPWVPNHPAANLGEHGVCPRCGSRKVQRRGYAFTLLGGRKQKFQCQACKGWFEGRAERGAA